MQKLITVKENKQLFERQLKMLTTYDQHKYLTKHGTFDEKFGTFRMNRKQREAFVEEISQLEREGFFDASYVRMRKREYIFSSGAIKKESKMF